jgi:ribosomal protein S18 acetylase RimI-like enzyme
VGPELFAGEIISMTVATLMQIVPAHETTRIPVVQELFQEYAAEIGVDLCFQGFSQELAELPGNYAPPEGALFIAEIGGQPAGCVALRRIGDGVCEMKRHYVRPEFRGRGVGRALSDAVIAVARVAPYAALRLDTLSSMKSAVALYRSIGLGEVPAYYDNPLRGVVYFELKLS